MVPLTARPGTALGDVDNKRKLFSQVYYRVARPFKESTARDVAFCCSCVVLNHQGDATRTPGCHAQLMCLQRVANNDRICDGFGMAFAAIDTKRFESVGEERDWSWPYDFEDADCAVRAEGLAGQSEIRKGGDHLTSREETIGLLQEGMM
jgi:hypothetical protein